MNTDKPTERLLRVLKHRRFHALLVLFAVMIGVLWAVSEGVFEGNVIRPAATSRRAESRADARRSARLARRGIVGRPSLFTYLGDAIALQSGEQRDFPSFGRAVFPVDRAPDWGAMRTPAVWDRPYAQMTDADFVPIPAYDMAQLTLPMERLSHPLLERNIPTITAKLFYSTRYFAAYDLDAAEFTGSHPGVDLKLPLGMPVRAVGGGIVRIAEESGPLGRHVMIEHRVGSGETVYSVYGHFDTIAVRAGDAVTAGEVIGTVGSTGDSTGPHLHLQIDRDDGMSEHKPYAPLYVPTREQAERWSLHPIRFIAQYGQ